ncbi:hypothetical protein OMP38_17700 [Cohnella ginsengisoli]|uniref:Uncharacterized protein n=1 Tax=Cohnella ginsengisoli TaxID=425004 RepID=A0A9X4KI34_9BACL|nr:hypothetical protein [Cohnella ginsengisoli]MDG0792503.1 hypothetical protein [Cohnella ginsengisoli]
MTALQCAVCATDDDFAQASLFLLEHMRDVHPSFSVLDTVTLAYHYIAEGSIVLVREGEEAVGLGAYYHGTREEAFNDKEIALIDLALAVRSHRGDPRISGRLRLYDSIDRGAASRGAGSTAVRAIRQQIPEPALREVRPALRRA